MQAVSEDKDAAAIVGVDSKASVFVDLGPRSNAWWACWGANGSNHIGLSRHGDDYSSGSRSQQPFWEALLA